MRRPRTLGTPICRRLAYAWLLALFLTSSAAVARSAEAQAAPSLAPHRNAQLVLVNASADSVRVQVRVGRSPNCTDNSRWVEHVVPPQRRWALSADTNICWRRARALHDAHAGWTGWQQHALAATGRQEIPL
jgi:hypothetical protein